jgi:hypothetical protein
MTMSNVQKGRKKEGKKYSTCKRRYDLFVFIDIQYHMDFTTTNTTRKHHTHTHNEHNACTLIIRKLKLR